MAKDSPKITAGELQKIFKSWGQKAKKKKKKVIYGQISFLAANTQYWFGALRDEKSPIQLNILLYL